MTVVTQTGGVYSGADACEDCGSCGRGPVNEFRAVAPIGTRSSGDAARRTGSTLNRWLDNDVPEHVAEYMQLTTGNLDPRLTKAQHKDALGILSSLKGRAARGQLPIGNDSDSPAKVMKRVGYVIELRPKLSRGPTPPRLFRLYYAEPEVVRNALLPLVLSTKPNDDDPDGEQNQSIDAAATRSIRWQQHRK